MCNNFQTSWEILYMIPSKRNPITYNILKYLEDQKHTHTLSNSHAHILPIYTKALMTYINFNLNHITRWIKWDSCIMHCVYLFFGGPCIFFPLKWIYFLYFFVCAFEYSCQVSSKSHIWILVYTPLGQQRLMGFCVICLHTHTHTSKGQWRERQGDRFPANAMIPNTISISIWRWIAGIRLRCSMWWWRIP